MEVMSDGYAIEGLAQGSVDVCLSHRSQKREGWGTRSMSAGREGLNRDVHSILRLPQVNRPFLFVCYQ